MKLTERERFLVMVLTQSFQPADAVVVLCGQDGEERANAGAEAFAHTVNWLRQNQLNTEAVTLVLSGGLSGNGLKSAQDVECVAWKYGIAPGRIVRDDKSMNTREQALAVAEMVKKCQWRRIVIIASAYHLPRAYLTFLKAFEDAKIADKCQIVMRPVSYLPFGGKPEGSGETRSELLEREIGKVSLYEELGHIADYRQGIASMMQWEGK